MISVSEALTRIQDLFQPLEVEEVPLRHAAGRVLARQVVARRDQPPKTLCGSGCSPRRIASTLRAVPTHSSR